MYFYIFLAISLLGWVGFFAYLAARYFTIFRQNRHDDIQIAKVLKRQHQKAILNRFL